MKTIKKYFMPITLLVLLAACSLLFIKAGKDKTPPNGTKGDFIESFDLMKDTVSNSKKDSTVIPINNYSKFTIYTGSQNNDSSSYYYQLYGGTAGMWILIWSDSITTITGENGSITTDAKIITYDMHGWGVTQADTSTSLKPGPVTITAPELFTEIKWCRQEKSSGNGKGTGYATKARAHDVFVGLKK